MSGIDEKDLNRLADDLGGEIGRVLTGHHWMLDASGEPVTTTDLLEWARWVENADRQVMKTEIGDVLISTVFLGIDCSHRDGPPVLWETMMFRDPRYSMFQRRYTSRADAIKGHEETVEMVKSGARYDPEHSDLLGTLCEVLDAQKRGVQ